jgi:glycine cleavage system aminomethyltransferase T
MITITPTTRIRTSPYFDAAVAAGAVSMVPYNRMLMPTFYGDAEAEYRRLTEGVAMWDVACERQIQLRGPDARRLAQILSTRDISKCAEGQGRYVALCNHRGTIINDPVLMMIEEDCYWFSIADSDVGFWASAIAAERGLDVEVSEPDVSPLAIQGPLAEDVVASLFGDWVRQLRYFGFADAQLEGIPLKVARSGWSKQGGFELYLMDGSRGVELWNLVEEAGRPWGIGPGCPNLSERVESGLLSWGGDTDADTNPYEVRLGRFVDLDVDDDVIGITALRRVAADGPKRHQLGIVLDGDDPQPIHGQWYDVIRDGEKVGDMTNGTWSYKLERNIGFGLLSVTCTIGARIHIVKSGTVVGGTVTDLPFTRVEAAAR